MKEISKKQLLRQAIESYIHKKLPEFSAEEHGYTSFSRLGLDSLGHVELSTVIEDTVGLQVEPEVAFNYPTLNALVDHVVDSLMKERTIGEEINGANA